jgi:hypothetical protein
MCLPCHANETKGGDFPATRSFLELLTQRFFSVAQCRASLLTAFCCGLTLCGAAKGQSTAAMEGQVIDANGAAVRAVQIVATNVDTSTTRRTVTDELGRYQLVALALGTYRVEVIGTGFQKQLIEKLTLRIGEIVKQDFQLKIGDLTQTVTVSTGHDMIEQATIAVGHVVAQRMVQQLPLNGRYFLDLGLLIPSSVTPPQGSFSSAPMRGLGSLAFNTGGNREETVNYLVNGITLNDLAFASISFQPAISSIQEFKVDNSTFSSEHGQSSGSIVTIATRSGTNAFHGEAFEFLRNDALDARNFFNFTSSQPPPFKRNQFGGYLGGPIIRDTLFFFTSYEALRQRQRLDVNSLVLTDAQRGTVNDPAIVKLLPLIPRANFVDSGGAARFVGSANAPVNADQWSLDISYHLNDRDQLHGYYGLYRTLSSEPTRAGNTIPGFGNNARVLRQIFTLNETHTFNAALVNEIRLGFNRFSSSTIPNAQLNPLDFGINNGITEPIGLPQISVAGSALNFGGPSAQPSGRGDTTIVAADSVNYLTGKHSLKFGGEFREFLNNNLRQGTGSFNFPTLAAFLSGTANSFSVTLGSQSSSVSQGALGFFFQDNFKPKSNLTFELGLRYEWNLTPTERYDRFIVFDPAKASLVRVGTDVDLVYHQNNKNFQPRVGVVWDPFKDGKTALRAAYSIQTDQPMTSVVIPTAANPPLAIPLTVSGPIRFDNALSLASPAGLAPVSINQGFDNAYSQSWNLNVQHEVTSRLALMAGYIGSKGTHLIIRHNINQPVNGVRPFPKLSPSSPILPDTTLGNITQVEGAGNSSYNGLWVSAAQRLFHGLQFNASYTWSKSIDYNSFSTGGIVGQDAYNLRGDRGLSDFDARNRFVISALYDLPFRGSQWVEGWQIATIVQSQSGSPVNIVTSNSTLTGVANTVRPDVNGPITIIGSVDRWFDTNVFSAVPRFGNLGRNVVIGPGFNNTDVSIIKNTMVGEKVRLQFRAEFFDVFNHANFGPPGNVVGGATFGRITSTRFPTGETGSSRQIQFAFKLIV